MSKSLVPQDAYNIINLLCAEITGQNGSIQAVDSSSFVSVGETVLSYGTETVLNTLARLIGRTMVASRPYTSKLSLINSINSGLYTERIRKISYYSKKALASGFYNTNLYNQHGDGMDNGVNQRVWNGSAIPVAGVSASILPTGGLPNMWEQHNRPVLELNFTSRDVWDDCETYYEAELKDAFRDENLFMQFAGGMMTELENDIEQQKESFNRMIILNFMAGVFDMNQGGSKFDLKAAFNSKFGTNYTSSQLLSTYYEDFLKFFVATYQDISDKMTYRSAKYHWSPSKTVNGVTYELLRHTPKDRQRLLIYGPALLDAEASVFSTIFNPNYLNLEGSRYEKVSFWQNINNPSKIDVVPAIPNTANPASQKTGSRVQLDNVFALLYDEDAMMIDYQLDSAYSTNIEARKGYRNVWYHYSYGAISDFTENAILFYLGNDV